MDLLRQQASPILGGLRVFWEGFILTAGISMVGVSALLLEAHHSAAKLERKNDHIKSLRKRKLEKISDEVLFLAILFVIVQVMAQCL